MTNPLYHFTLIYKCLGSYLTNTHAIKVLTTALEPNIVVTMAIKALHNSSNAGTHDLKILSSMRPLGSCICGMHHKNYISYQTFSG